MAKFELTKAETKQATEYAKKLRRLLKSALYGDETVNNKPFSRAMIALRDEIDQWGFYGDF